MGRSKLFSGVLENAGLGEVAYFLKKSKHNLDMAEYALGNTNFDEITAKSAKLKQKMEKLHNVILEIDGEIEQLATELIAVADSVEESDEEKEE